MAITKLPTNFKDDILDTSVNEHRKYQLTAVSGEEDTFQFEDVSTYIQTGTEFNAEKANATNTAVNAVIDLAEENASDIEEILDGTQSVGRAVLANNATQAVKLKTARNINGVSFDGTGNIQIYDDTKVSTNKDFILINQQTLTFVDGVCRLNDSRVTENSLADVYFTSATEASASNAGIVVDTYNGYVQLTASSTPSTSLVASIHVKVVE